MYTLCIEAKCRARSLWFRKAIVRNATGCARQMRRGLTGDSSHLLRPDVQEIRKRQGASDQLPALLEIQLVEAVGPGPAHRLGGRAQRHVNYVRPCRKLNIVGIESTQHCQWAQNKGTRETGGDENHGAVIAICLRREGRTTADWRAGRDAARGRVGARLLPPSCPCLHVAMHSPRLALTPHHGEPSLHCTSTQSTAGAQSRY